ncbi:MAG: dihydrofolate reductase family protein [Armatimonadota bacterium]
MSKVVAIEQLTLDGIYQGPGRPDEDRRGSFEYGGWASAGSDPKMQDVMRARMGGSWSLLVGRITYDDFYDFWPKQPPNPMTDALNRVEKFVASTTRTELSWQHSTLLRGEATNAVEKLSKEHGKTLVIFGSGVLVQSLMKRNFIDEYVLMLHPLILGQGRRLFTSGNPLTKLKLVDSVVTSTGVIVATYHRHTT